VRARPIDAPRRPEPIISTGPTVADGSFLTCKTIAATALPDRRGRWGMRVMYEFSHADGSHQVRKFVAADVPGPPGFEVAQPDRSESHPGVSAQRMPHVLEQVALVVLADLVQCDLHEC